MALTGSGVARAPAKWAKRKAPPMKICEGQVSSVDANDVIAIIRRRQAKFEAQLRSRSREDTDESDLLIADEYDILLAEIELEREE